RVTLLYVLHWTTPHWWSHPPVQQLRATPHWQDHPPATTTVSTRYRYRLQESRPIPLHSLLSLIINHHH
ncbi:hypothetical protein LINPERHAP1_LOCUS13403, partial [Linum perenne]